MANNDIALLKQEICDQVESKIGEYIADGALHMPANYSPHNAIKSAWLIIQQTKDKNQNPALSVCTRHSVCNALLDTVIQGLNPAKNQVYYIVYGNELQATRSYHGTIAITKRMKGVESVSTEVIYKGDEIIFDIDRGIKKITKHVQKFENISEENIVGAYCTIVHDGGQEYTEIMTKAQIEVSWSKRKNNGAVQKEFPSEMARRTVASRACKRFVATSDDSDLVMESFNASEEREHEEIVQAEIDANANTEELSIDGDFEIVEGTEEPNEPEQAEIIPDEKKKAPY